MSRTITNSDIKKEGKKFHAVADWRDGSEGGTERETFDTFDQANQWIQKLESESDNAENSDNEQSSPANSGNSQSDTSNENTNHPPVPVPGQDNSGLNGDNSHSPAASGQSADTVPTATDKDTLPEPAASEMNAADAENINSNINLAPSTVLAGRNGEVNSNQDPFSNPLTDGQTAADTQAAPTDHDTSHEVTGAQNPNDTESATANAGKAKTDSSSQTSKN